GPNPGFSPFR
uniref:Nephilakinin-1 n=1 Tax=Trichonephila clavipes TaxID=2585209 RepID=BRK1_TRICX|nr:RecName: Full=Nephilakinin-1; AltName: Full=Nephilakinin-I [Trichonephila clavipes]